MTHKLTPGPWKVSQFNERRVLHSKSNKEIALCEQSADARLAAQAPVMADLCRHLAAGEMLDAAVVIKAAEQIVAEIDSAY